jgi:hypothetical protein
VPKKKKKPKTALEILMEGQCGPGKKEYRYNGNGKSKSAKTV